MQQSSEEKIDRNHTWVISTQAMCENPSFPCSKSTTSSPIPFLLRFLSLSSPLFSLSSPSLLPPSLIGDPYKTGGIKSPHHTISRNSFYIYIKLTFLVDGVTKWLQCLGNYMFCFKQIPLFPWLPDQQPPFSYDPLLPSSFN